MWRPKVRGMVCASFANPSKKVQGKLLFAFTALTFLTARIAVAAETVGFEELQSQAKLAYVRGQHSEAFALMTRAISVEPQNPRGYFVRARFHEESREPAKAIADYDQVIKLD